MALFIIKVNYSGTKEYDEAFSDIKSKSVGKSTQYTVTGLFPGTSYKFKVYATSACGDSSPLTSDVKTKMAGTNNFFFYSLFLLKESTKFQRNAFKK